MATEQVPANGMPDRYLRNPFAKSALSKTDPTHKTQIIAMALKPHVLIAYSGSSVLSSA